MSPPYTLADQQKILDILEMHREMAGALLPILQTIQEALGYIPEPSLPLIAKALNLSRAEVYGVVTYYHDFGLSPPGRHLVQICRAEACQARGANSVIAHAENRLGCALHGQSPDGDVTLEPIYCLGQCAVGPAVLIDRTQIHAQVDAARFDRLIEELKHGQEDRS